MGLKECLDTTKNCGRKEGDGGTNWPEITSLFHLQPNSLQPPRIKGRMGGVAEKEREKRRKTGKK